MNPFRLVQQCRRVGACLLLLLVTVLPAASDPASDPVVEAQQELLALSLPPVERAPWRFTDFPIVGWWGPPGTASQEDFDRYAAAGFTLYALNPDTGFDSALAKARAAGLKLLAFRQPQGFGLPDAEVQYPEAEADLVGWIAQDEPEHPADVLKAIHTVHALMADSPDRRAFFNLFPPFFQPPPGTETIVDVSVRNALPILSYDHYIMMADGATRSQAHFDYLELFRRKSLEHDVPFWAFALTTKHYRYRRPSESDVRFKQFTNLAYGAKGLWYFTYWGPTDWPRWDSRAIVDPADGSPTDLYEAVKRINGAVLKIKEPLLASRSLDVVHTSPPAGCRPFTPAHRWIVDIEATDALIGFFDGPSGEQYALIVNKLHGPAKSPGELTDTIYLRFSPRVRHVEALSWLDGDEGVVSADGSPASLSIAGGTGVFLEATVEPFEAPLTRIVEELPSPDVVYTRRIAEKVSRWYAAHPLAREESVAMSDAATLAANARGGLQSHGDPGYGEANGSPVRNARENGKAFVTLADALGGSPDPQVQTAFESMADRLLAVQNPRDGLWRPGLLDAESCPLPDSWGSALICYGFARAANLGHPRRAEYAEAARRAWKGLTACVYPDGGLGYAQPSHNPVVYPPDSETSGAVGAFLTAAREMEELLGR